MINPPMTFEQIVAEIQSWPDVPQRDCVGAIAIVASLLGVFDWVEPVQGPKMDKEQREGAKSE